MSGPARKNIARRKRIHKRAKRRARYWFKPIDPVLLALRMHAEWEALRLAQPFFHRLR